MGRIFKGNDAGVANYCRNIESVISFAANKVRWVRKRSGHHGERDSKTGREESGSGAVYLPT